MENINTLYIKTSLGEDDTSMISTHYINEVLPTKKQYQNVKLDNIHKLIYDEEHPLSSIMASSKKMNERQIEDVLIRPILEALGNTLKAQIPLLGDTVDFCTYEPNPTIEPDGFANDYTNVTAIIESKRYGRIENKYFVRAKGNDDEIYQTLNYLRTMNLTLNNSGSKHNINYAVLTDGYRWRIYSKNYTHNIKEYENHFIEFNLEAIISCDDLDEREHLLKLFCLFFSNESLSGNLMKYEKESSELEVAVTSALKEQTFTALEYIATGLWREIVNNQNPNLANTLKTIYDIDVDKINIE